MKITKFAKKNTMEKINIKDDNYYRELREHYLNDAFIKRFADMTARILENSFPSYIMDKKNGEITTVYDKATTDALERINKERSEYIRICYPELISEK